MITIENDRALGNAIGERPREPREKAIRSESVSLKVCPYHQERLAVVYVRQSSPQQVLEQAVSNLNCNRWEEFSRRKLRRVFGSQGMRGDGCLVYFPSRVPGNGICLESRFPWDSIDE